MWLPIAFVFTVAISLRISMAPVHSEWNPYGTLLSLKNSSAFLFCSGKGQEGESILKEGTVRIHGVSLNCLSGSIGPGSIPWQLLFCYKAFSKEAALSRAF